MSFKKKTKNNHKRKATDFPDPPDTENRQAPETVQKTVPERKEEEDISFMKTETIKVTNQGNGMEEALTMSEKAGQNSGLTRKELLRLRLLSEELFTLVRSIAGDPEVYYWMEYENKRFVIHLDADVKLTQKMYNEFLDVSTHGKNDAVRGLMANIKNMIFLMTLPHSHTPTEESLGAMKMGSPASRYAGSGAYHWSLKQYRATLENIDTEEETYDDEIYAAALDDLEQSILAVLADEISVSITGTHVAITIFKSFDR